MAGSALAGDFGKDGVLFGSEREVLVVGVKRSGDALAFLGSVKRRGGNVIDANLLIVELPGNQIVVANAVEPGAFPGHKTAGNKFPGKIRIFGCERLEFVEGDGVADGPGNQRGRGARQKEERNSQEAQRLASAEKKITQDKQRRGKQ